MIEKNNICIIIIVLCFVSAAVIFVVRQSQRDAGVESLKPGKLTWVKCMECEALCQMDEKDYYRQIQEKKRANPDLTMLPMDPPLACKECGKEAAFRAVKCEKCGHVFFYGARKEIDHADRCPKCSFSKNEEGRRAAR